MKKLSKVFLCFLLAFVVISTIQVSTVSAAQTFIKPVAGTYTSPFGMRVHPITGKYQLHAGLDISAPSGTTIKAAAAGSVVKSTYHSGWGNYVTIRHSIAGKTYDTLYAHMTTRKVAVGATVSQGQAIGTVGMTGSATGPHLHLELHKGGYLSSNANAVDPKPYIEGQINPQVPHKYDGTWATVEIVNPSGGSTINLFSNVGYGIIGTLPVGNKYKVYGLRETAANGDIYYNVGAGYIYSLGGKIYNHHATVNKTINTYKSPNGAFDRTLAPGTYKVHGAKDGWYNLGNTWVNASSVVVTKQ